MAKLWNLLIAALLLSFIIAYRDKHFNKINASYLRYDKITTLMLVILLGVFCGLRTFYNDTITYIQIYEQAPVLKDFAELNTSTYAQGIGFAFVNSIMKTLGFSTQDYLMFY